MAASQLSAQRSPDPSEPPPDLPAEMPSKRRYLRPSVFWSIRQGFPSWLQVALVVVSLMVPVLIWGALSYGGYVNPKFLPTPSEVIVRGVAMLSDGELMVDIFASLARVMAGFTFAALVGIPVGIAMGTFYSMDSLLGGFVRTARYMPIAAFVPLIIIWAGIDETSKVIIIFWALCFITPR